MRMRDSNDIEIYVRDCSLVSIRAWLSATFGPLSEFEEVESTLFCRSRDVDIVITPAIENGPFISIWFPTAGTPWRTDVECARQAAQQLRVTVRCDPGNEFPEVHPSSDVFLEIYNGTERLLVWE